MVPTHSAKQLVAFDEDGWHAREQARAGKRDEASAAGDGVQGATENSGDEQHDGGIEGQGSRCIRNGEGMSGAWSTVGKESRWLRKDPPDRGIRGIPP